MQHSNSQLLFVFSPDDFEDQYEQTITVTVGTLPSGEHPIIVDVTYLCIEGRIRGEGYASPSGLSKHEMWRFTACLVHIATPTQVHISTWITASCPENIKHSNLQLPIDSSVAVPQIQRLIPKRKDLRNDHTMNRLSYTPVTINFAWLWWSPMASEALL